MRTTVTIDDAVVEYLRSTTGIKETSALVRQALLEMQQREVGRRLAALGGTMRDLHRPPRRKPTRFRNSE